MDNKFLSQNLPAVRDAVRLWTQRNKCTLATVAERARINKSVVHRLMHGGHLELATAVKLYEVLHGELGQTDRRQLLQALGLMSAADILATSAPDRPRRFVDSATKARLMLAIAKLNEASQTAHTNPIAALDLYREAEQMLAYHQDLAAAAAGERIQILINTGQTALAQTEILKTESLVAPDMGAANRARFASLRAWLCFDMNDFAESERWFDKLHEWGRVSDDLMSQSEATHFLALISLARSRRAKTSNDARAWALRAERMFQNHRGLSSRLPATRIDEGFACYRQSEILDALGKTRQAAELRNKARMHFAGETAIGHIDTAEAGLAMKRGDLAKAQALAEGALEIATGINYRLGISRALYHLSVAASLKGDATTAVEEALLIQYLTPRFEDDSGYKIGEYVSDLLCDVRRHSSSKAYARFEQEVQSRIDERKGRFSVMNVIGAVHTQTLASAGIGILIK